MLHSGAIADENGRVAALIAASGTGKTTATRYFCSNGYGYLSDETLIVNDAGDIMPYPKPLSVIINPEKPGTKSQYGPDQLGLKLPTSKHFTLGAVILLKRLTPEDDDGGVVPRLEEVDMLEGLTQILPQSSATPDIPGSLNLLMQLAVAGGGIQQLVYREIDTTAPLIAQALRLPAAPTNLQHIPGSWPSGEDAPNRYAPRPPAELPQLDDDLRIRRGIFVDALSNPEGFEILVLAGSLPAHLSGPGAVIWRAAEHGCRYADLKTACVEALGEHPEADLIVSNTFIQLWREHLIVAQDDE